MLVSHTHKFVFIHIYKTAGTSIARGLAPYNVSPYKRRTARFLKRIGIPFPSQWHTGLSVEHKTAIEARAQLGKGVFDRYFSFAFVRNPWDWQVSIYRHVTRNKEHSQHARFVRFGNFNSYVRWLCEGDSTERDLRGQVDFLQDENGKQVVDFVGRFESLPSDFELVCQKIGIEAQLPRLNTAQHQIDYRAFFDNRSVDMIAARYAEDIQRFGYEFEMRRKSSA
jgi:hypothetical protein